MEERIEYRIGEERMELYVTCLHSGSRILSGFLGGLGFRI